MKAQKNFERARQKALIYCRISGKKQKEGSGLSSQEHRCRQHAEEQNYEVVKVFPDDVTGGGDFIKRKGMVALLKYLDDNPDEQFVVIFDDLKRYARDTEFHLKLRRLMSERNAKRECLNFKFDDTEEGKFYETIVAAQGELERTQMGRQNRQKSKARIEQGYAVTRAPVGYKYVKVKGGGKELFIDEPVASVVKEALEGYASGRFASQTEVRRFLQASPHFPKDLHNGKIRPQTIPRLLSKVMYAGYVEAPKWGISRRIGKHKGLISYATYQKIQERMNKGVYAPTRKDIKPDFPLRGAVACACCGTPLTAGWSKGKYKKYPYYNCRNKACEKYGKSIPKAKIEGEFETLLTALMPIPALQKAAEEMFKNVWQQLTEQTESIGNVFVKKATETEKQIDSLVERMIEVTNQRMLSAMERKLAALEDERLGYLEKSRNNGVSNYTYRELFELSMKFLLNPCKIWNSGRYELQRLVLKLAFSEHLAYCNEQGFLNTKKSLPFNVLDEFLGCKNKMVPLGRIELPASPLPMVRSTTELQRLKKPQIA